MSTIVRTLVSIAIWFITPVLPAKLLIQFTRDARLKNIDTHRIKIIQGCVFCADSLSRSWLSPCFSLSRQLVFSNRLHLTCSITMYDMIKNRDSQYLPGLSEPFGNLDILSARLWIARWMVMLCGVQNYVKLNKEKCSKSHSSLEILTKVFHITKVLLTRKEYHLLVSRKDRDCPVWE